MGVSRDSLGGVLGGGWGNLVGAKAERTASGCRAFSRGDDLLLPFFHATSRLSILGRGIRLAVQQLYSNVCAGGASPRPFFSLPVARMGAINKSSAPRSFGVVRLEHVSGFTHIATRTPPFPPFPPRPFPGPHRERPRASQAPTGTFGGAPQTKLPIGK